MKIAACLTSKSMHYCTPPRVIVPARRVLVPKGSGRTLIDPWTNDASQVGADLVCDGEKVDGHQAKWTAADTSFENPPYGEEILACVETSHHWHVEVGMPGISLYPARTDTVWMQGGRKGKREVVGVYRSADAWVEVKGRLAFWRPISITRDGAPGVEKGERYYMQRWWPWATDEKLPKPFRLVSPGLAVGPEVAGPSGKPATAQSAPFPSLIAFWADREGRYGLREEGAEHPIDVREFAKRFRPLGTLIVARGDHRGVYPWRSK